MGVNIFNLDIRLNAAAIIDSASMGRLESLFHGIGNRENTAVISAMRIVQESAEPAIRQLGDHGDL